MNFALLILKNYICYACSRIAPRAHSEYHIKKVYQKPQEELTFEDQSNYYVAREALHALRNHNNLKKDLMADSETQKKILRKRNRAFAIDHTLSDFVIGRESIFGRCERIYDYPRNLPFIDLNSI